jgi:hypothetical protein
MVSEKEYLAPVVSDNTSEIASHIIYGNSQEIVKQQNYIFDILWNFKTNLQKSKKLDITIRVPKWCSNLTNIHLFNFFIRRFK